ncbi:MAG: cell division protein FtsZ [Gemmatimonadetes bacterium]|nr:cell division protein FtsZ [Gemmatimonadota bacterium]MYB99558.1 cell division protein FtsZ [Gemmatimonadota bacterium]MYI47031.1 cell division protein FtsZ [Gemmatimonadota bacterium]
MIFTLDEAPRNRALMRVIGVGGAGGNAVNRMIDEKLEGVEFISANTDAQALAASKAPTTIQLGKRLTQGLGAGARPGIGRQAISEDADEVRAALEGADLVFITAGMGGGTGTGSAPVIGEMARELGALVIAVVTRPFRFEGKKRLRQADQGLEELGRTVDTMIVVPNEQLLSVVGKGTSFRDALKKADEVLLQATQGISDLIRVSGEVNVDFADVRTIMSSCGAALMGTGVGRGENRALKAASDAVTSPLLENVSIRGAQGVLINITGGSDLTIDEVTGISTMIQDEVGDEAEIIFGAVHDSSMDGELRVTLIATGFEEGQEMEEEQAVIQPVFGAARQQQAGLRAVGGGRVDPVQQPTIVRRETGGARRQFGGGGPTQQPFHGSNMETPRAAADGRMGMEGARATLATGMGSRAARGSVARPSLGGGYRGRSTGMDSRELELPTFIKRLEA